MKKEKKKKFYLWRLEWRVMLYLPAFMTLMTEVFPSRTSSVGSGTDPIHCYNMMDFAQPFHQPWLNVKRDQLTTISCIIAEGAHEI